MYNWYSIRAGAGSCPSAGKFPTIHLNVFWVTSWHRLVGVPCQKISAALFVVICIRKREFVSYVHRNQTMVSWFHFIHSLPRYLSHTPMDVLLPTALTSLATSKIIIMLAIVHNNSENCVKNHWMTKPNPNNTRTIETTPFRHHPLRLQPFPFDWMRVEMMMTSCPFLFEAWLNYVLKFGIFTKEHCHCRPLFQFALEILIDLSAFYSPSQRNGGTFWLLQSGGSY